MVNDVDYEIFVFLISMHESSLDFGSQFNLCSHKHADAFSHSEHEDEIVFEFYMNYKNEEIYFVFPSDVIQDANLIGKIEKNNSILRQGDVNENQVFDRGKEF